MNLSSKKTELQAARQTIKFFETLLHASTDGIVITSNSRKIIVANGAFCKIFSQNKREMIETDLFIWLEYFDDNAQQTWVDVEKSIDLEGACHDAEFRLSSDDKNKYFHVNASNFKQNAGQEQEIIISIWRDVTIQKLVNKKLENEIKERKLAQASLQKLYKELDRRVKDRTNKLEHANSELSQYAYVVSHDLKAPLRAIHNYSDFLREDLEGSLDGDQKEYLDGLSRAVHQGEELINDLLTLARVDISGDADEEIDSKVFIRELVGNMNMPDTMELLLSDDLPVIKTDKILFTRIFQNLIDNGIKFNNSQVKCIQISLCSTGEENVEIMVHDNGIGIEERFLKKIFQIFQRLHTRSEYEGSGIGLSIVNKAVQKIGGSIRVESELGKGSKFIITIPHLKKGGG